MDVRPVERSIQVPESGHTCDGAKYYPSRTPAQAVVVYTAPFHRCTPANPQVSQRVTTCIDHKRCEVSECERKDPGQN